MLESAAAPAASRVLLVGALVAWSVLEIRRSRVSRPDSTHVDRGSVWVLRLTTLGGFVAAAALAVLLPDAALPAWLVAWGPLVLVCAGAGLRLWSFRTLGAYFTYTVQVSHDQPVIDTGPYRYVRHPAYLGMLVALSGVALLLGSWPGLLAFEVLTIAGLAYRIRVEEQAMQAALGERWTRYAARTRRLIPMLW